MVLFITTIYIEKETVKRLRRGLAVTSINTRTSRLPFGDLLTKSLEIPQFIDIYNYFIGGVDQTD